jgi:CHAT domain-containing protein
MLLYALPLGDVIAVLAVTRDASAGHVVPVSSAELSSSVDVLRQGLDPARWHNTVEPFPREAAYRLYNLLLKPVAPMLRHSRTMFVVAGTPLSALPMSVLVTKPPLGGVAGDSSPDALRNTAWLGRDIGIVRIPSASVISLRETIGDDRPTSEAFLGVGAPRATAQAPALPAAEGELRRIAVALGEPTAGVLSGLSATKAAFLSSAPGRKRVIAFATHALTARENPAGEPALVLTRSREEKGTRYDTLPASEIATLELSSDWVILSGCNTAGDGAQSASTLARAFLQAGARSLLVSHWPVSDRAAALMTTTVMSEYAARPTNGQAEALRRAIGKTITDVSHPLNAHPSSWAAFSLYGEASSGSGRED